MSKVASLRGVVVVGLLSVAAEAAAQDATYDSGYIHYAEGDVRLQRAENPEPEPGEANVPVLPGDRVWTTAGSFAEIRLADDTVLRLGEETKIDFIKLGDAPVVRLWNGSVHLEVQTEGSRVRIDTPGGSVYQQTPGIYRVDVRDGATTTLSVRDGVAELGSEHGSVLVHAGERSLLEYGQAPGVPFPVTATADAFDVWSQERDRPPPMRRDVPLADIPDEVHHYVDDLDDYGSWSQSRDYGAVWYPSVAVGWAPYRNGRWCYTSYGYTWVSYEPWGWAPYHYGRWGFNHRGWYWIPGRHWGPAWVSFAVGPAWIGWSPLGYHGRPVFAYNHIYYGNRYGGFGKSRHHFRGGKAVPRHVYDHGAGWNFSRREHFGKRGHARLRAEDVRLTAARARVHDGAVLDRHLTPRSFAGSAGLRGGGRTPFASGDVATTRDGRRELEPDARRGSVGVAEPRARARSAPGLAGGTGFRDLGAARARERSGATRDRASEPIVRNPTRPTTSGSRVLRTPSPTRSELERARSRDRIREPQRTTPPRARATPRSAPTRTFGADEQRGSSNRRDDVSRSRSRARSRDDVSSSTPRASEPRTNPRRSPSSLDRSSRQTPRRATPRTRDRRDRSSMTRTRSRDERPATGARAPSSSRSSVHRSAPRNPRPATRAITPSRDRSSVTRRAPRARQRSIQRPPPNRRGGPTVRGEASRAPRGAVRDTRSPRGSRAPGVNRSSTPSRIGGGRDRSPSPANTRGSGARTRGSRPRN